MRACAARDPRLCPDRRVHRPAGEAVFVGHVRPAGVLALRAPGARCLHRGRGAVRRRHLLPAEVLRAVPGAARARAARSSWSATTSEAITHLCDRAILLSGGKLRLRGRRRYGRPRLLRADGAVHGVRGVRAPSGLGGAGSPRPTDSAMFQTACGASSTDPSRHSCAEAGNASDRDRRVRRVRRRGQARLDGAVRRHPPLLVPDPGSRADRRPERGDPLLRSAGHPGLRHRHRQPTPHVAAPRAGRPPALLRSRSRWRSSRESTRWCRRPADSPGAVPSPGCCTTGSSRCRPWS